MDAKPAMMIASIAIEENEDVTTEDTMLVPSALTTHLACTHATVLDRAHALGEIAGPSRRDPTREQLAKRGQIHEARYVEYLRSLDEDIVDLRGHRDLGETRRAMERGAFAILQAPLGSGDWRGAADVLRRVGRPSELGAWSYEAYDAKLARQTKPGAIVQLGLYSVWIAELQGLLPERMWIVAPGDPFREEQHRPRDILAYVRHVQRRFEIEVREDLAVARARSYPEPCDHCEVCRWWHDCKVRRVADDHLSLVAGLSRSQAGVLRDAGISTLAALATGKEAIPMRPAIGARESYVRAHEQARVQMLGRQAQRVLHELLDPVDPGFGLRMLPEPSGGDLFLDLEGDAFVGVAGLEYLFGLSWIGDGGGTAYEGRWAHDAASEHASFEWAIDTMIAALEANPTMHVYHFGAYEPSSLKRLVGRHATRIAELDYLLRGGVLVDLHRVVKLSLRASVERYSLKELEPLFEYEREVELPDARAARRAVEAALELERPQEISDEERAVVQGYNADDCRSTRVLRDWLERRRTEVQASTGIVFDRPERRDPNASREVADRNQDVAEAVMLLRLEMPDDPEARDDDQRARWLLSNLVGFHHREFNAAHWEYYRRLELPEEDREDDRNVIAGLQHIDTSEQARSWVHRYRYPAQETAITEDDQLFDGEGELCGTVVDIDPAASEIWLKISKTKWTERPHHPSWAFVDDRVDPKPKPLALLQFADDVIEGRRRARWTAARALLWRESPTLLEGHSLARQPGESNEDHACRVVLALDRSVLAIQGPPGSGKTHTGAEMIVRLVQAGKKVGVTAMSHAVIRKLIDDVVENARKKGVVLGVAVKPKDISKSSAPARGVVGAAKSTADALRWLDDGDVQVLGGTTWLWADDRLAQKVDVLFVDEAGQLSLADALAVAGAAKSVVLLGDPQQLEQPRKASHPDGADVSALGHVLAGADTIDATRGLFLDVTWRLPPGICELTSELFYEGKLAGRPELSKRELLGAPAWPGKGIWYRAVEHVRRGVKAPEEVDAIDAIVAELLGGGVQWRDEKGELSDLAVGDVMLMAPYNAQVGALAERLRARGVTKVGTVDRFQGQQAPVVIWSITSSSSADAPRGMKFLYDGHRLNVATSRAKVACIVVGSPRLFEAECRTVEQVRMLSRWCELRERAR